MDDQEQSLDLSPVRHNVNDNASASTSKVLIITPEQIAKLGLTQQIKAAVKSQVSSTSSVKSNTKVKSSPSKKIKSSTVHEGETGNEAKEQKLQRKEKIKSDIKDVTTETLAKETLKPSKKKCKNVTPKIKNKQKVASNSEEIAPASQETSKVEEMPSSSAKMTAEVDKSKSEIAIKLQGSVILSMKSKLLSLLETGGALGGEQNQVNNITDSISTVNPLSNKNSTKVKKESISTKRKTKEDEVVFPPSKISKISTTTTFENKIKDSEIISEESVNYIDTTNSNISKPSSLTKDTNVCEINTNKTPKRAKLKASPNISKISFKREIKKTENENFQTETSEPSSPNVLKETSETKETPKPPKIHVLSNEQISLPQTYIDQMLKQNFYETKNQTLQICKPIKKIITSNYNKPELMSSKLPIQYCDVPPVTIQENCSGNSGIISSSTHVLPYGKSELIVPCSSSEQFQTESISNTKATESILKKSLTKNLTNSKIISQPETPKARQNLELIESIEAVPFKSKFHKLKSSEELSENVNKAEEILTNDESNKRSMKSKIKTTSPEKSFGDKHGTHLDKNEGPAIPVKTCTLKTASPQKIKDQASIKNKNIIGNSNLKNNNEETEKCGLETINNMAIEKVSDTSATSGTSITETSNILKAESKEKCETSIVSNPETSKKNQLKHGTSSIVPQKFNEALQRKQEKVSEISDDAASVNSPPANKAADITLTSQLNEVIEKISEFSSDNLGKPSETSSNKETKHPFAQNIKALSDTQAIGTAQEKDENITTVRDQELLKTSSNKTETEPVKANIEASITLKHIKSEVETDLESNTSTKDVLSTNNCNSDKQQQTPKKRGRKKKSEIVTPIKEEPEIISDIPALKIEPSPISGRKRKVLNYAALAEGEDFTEAETKKRKILPVIKANKDTTKVEQTDTLIPLSPENIQKPLQNSTDAESANPFLPTDLYNQKDEAPENNSNESNVSTNPTAGLEITWIRIEGDDPSQVEMGKPKVSQKMPKDVVRISKTEGLKRKVRGRPRKHPLPNEVIGSMLLTNANNQLNKNTNAESTITSEPDIVKRKHPGRPRMEDSVNIKMMNSIFHYVNTPPTTTNETDELISSDIKGNVTAENVNCGNSSTKTEHKWITKEEHPVYDTLTQTNVSAEESETKVICAVCNKQVDKLAWQYHKLRYHNNLTWKIGEPPLDLNDQKLVMGILTDIYKRKKPLYCEHCSQSKKSVLGFLSHKSVCNRSSEEVTAMRIKCEYCEKSVMPVSMSAHLKTCRGLHPERNIPEIRKPVVEELELPEISKRKAATKAEKLLQEFKEDKTFGEDKAKASRLWYVNFDFRPTYFGKKRFQYEITLNGSIKCRFSECNFESSDIDEISNHLSICDKKPLEGFTCRFCIVTFKSEEEISEHIEESHSKYFTSISLPTDDTNENQHYDKEEYNYEAVDVKPKRVPGKANLLHGIQFLLQHRYCTPTTGVAYPPAVEWTLKFCDQHFSTPNLFPNWRMNIVNFERLDLDMLCKYLPRLRYSACTARIETKKFVDPLKLDYDWKRYKLFEAEMLHNGTSIIFCGGSIFAMAWAPTPHNESDCEQILAVSTNNDLDRGYKLHETYREPGLIQFWNCGILRNDNIPNDKPRLQFCIAHDYGPAWCLEWCPSGCYDTELNEKSDSLRRLGILAVGCADSNIYVYSVCFPIHMSGKMFKPKPVLKLVLNSVTEEAVSGVAAHVTKLSWNKTAGHQHLVAGYANGIVAMYDLTTVSSLLNVGFDQEDVKMLMPYHVFNAHYHAVTALSLYHLTDGRRWLMTGSIDRTIKYWDLQNPVVPITNFMKLIVTDGVWLSHWISTVQTFDDSCGGGLTYTAAHQLRNFESETSSIMHSNSRVSTISGSEWANGFVQGNIVGEIKGFFPHQMFYGMDSDKSFRNKRVILGYARLVEKNLSIQERLKEEQLKLKKVNSKPTQSVRNENTIDLTKTDKTTDSITSEPTTYGEAEKKYGLVFCDMRVNCVKDFPANIDSYFKSNNANKLYASRPNVYPMQSINKVALNPNRRSFLYLAAGYHVGFIRISCLRFLHSNEAWSAYIE